MAPGQVHKDETQRLLRFFLNNNYFNLSPIHFTAFNQNTSSAKDFILNKFLHEPESHLTHSQFL